jgi:hypothetical protein
LSPSDNQRGVGPSHPARALLQIWDFPPARALRDSATGGAANFSQDKSGDNSTREVVAALLLV